MEELRACMELMKLMLNSLGVRENILTEEKYKYLFSVEKVNELVNQGIPFRDAYAQVGNMIDQGTFSFDATQKLNHTHEGSIGNLCTAEISEAMKSVAAIIKIG
jgi:argininosuccinate lyase